MKVQINNLTYTNKDTTLPTQFEFDIADEIASNDDLLAQELIKLIAEQTGAEIDECDVDVLD